MACLLAGVLLVWIGTAARGQMADVVAGLEKIAPVAKPISFARGAGDLPRAGHEQGIQMRYDAKAGRQLAFLSHDSATVGYLVVVAFPADFAAAGRVVHIHTFPSDGQLPPLRHAGGMQLIDDVLVVGLEDNQQKTRSEIQFWDVSDAEKPIRLEHLTVQRSGAPKDKTAGAVGIVRRADDYLLAVANWDARAIDFYRSNGKPLGNPACRFAFHVRWQDDAADKDNWRPERSFGAYQAINLVADAAGKLFLIGFATAALETDRADLYALDTSRPAKQLLQKLSSKVMRLPAGNHFRYAGGVSMLPGGPAVLASPRNLGPQTTLSIAR